MKRLRIFVGAGAFLLCIVTPLFAQQVDIKTTGQVRVRYRDWQEFFMDDNLPIASQGGIGRDRHYFDIRTRFGVTAKLEPGLTGVIEIERYDDFGTHSLFAAAANQTISGAASSTSPAGATQSLLGVPANTDSLYFRQAYVDWMIPGTPIHIAGGRQLPTVGGAIVFSGAIYGVDGLQVYSPLGPGTIGAYWWKPQVDGNRRMMDNDFDVFGGSYKFEWMARNSVEVYGLLSNDKLRAKAATAYSCAGASGDCAQTNEYFLGAAFFGVQGPFTYRLEGAYQGGTARKNVAATAALGNSAGDIDRSAGFVAGGVSYALVPELALNLDGGYASGDDNAADNTHSNFASVYGFFQPTNLFFEGTAFGNTSAAQIGNNATNRAFFNTTLGTADLDLSAMTDNNGARFSPGMIYAKPGVKWVPHKQLTINGDVALLWAAVTGAGVDSYIGTELDLKAAWAVYKNLNVNWYFGYLLAGEYFDRPVANANVDDPWFSTVEFVLTF